VIYPAPIREVYSRRTIPATGNYSVRRRVGRRLGSAAQVETQGISTGAGAAASYGTGAALAAAGVGGGALLGTVVPIVGTVIGALIGSLLSAHFARQAGAKNENAALNQLMPIIQTDVQSVVTAYNSGSISAADAITALQAIQSNYWQAAAQFEKSPGQAGGPNTCLSNGTQIGAAGTPMTSTVPCDKNHTASTCVGCIYLNNYVSQLSQLLQAGKTGTFQLQAAIPANGYGFTGAPALTVTLSAPPVSSGLSSVLSALPSGVATTLGLTSTSTGLPTWVWLAGGLAAYFFFFR